jgi:hypothetical protein
MKLEIIQPQSQIKISSVGVAGANGTSGTSGISGTSGVSMGISLTDLKAVVSQSIDFDDFKNRIDEL